MLQIYFHREINTKHHVLQIQFELIIEFYLVMNSA